MIKISALMGCACMATSLIAGTAMAGTLTSTDNGVNPGTTNLKITFNSGTNWTSGATVGEFNWTVVSSSLSPGDPGYGSLSAGSTYTSFCIEGTQYVSNGSQYSYTLTSDVASAPIPGTGMGAEKAAFLTEFWGRNSSLLAGASNTTAAAFQLAIWDIVYDGPTAHPANPSADASYFSGATFASIFGTGKFQVSSLYSSDAAVTQAITLLKKLTGSYTASGFVLGALESGTSQDQIAAFSPSVGAPSAVPLPAALPVGGAMLGAMGLVAGWRKKRASK